jgi:flagellar hook-associated protein 3 FlgL
MLSSFYPAVAGRTSDALARNRSLFMVQASRLSVQALEEQLSTGRRFSVPSQDPTSAIRVMGIQRDLEFRDQTLRNLDSSQGYLNVTESTLANVQNIMVEIRGLGIESAGNLSSEEERNGWISQINASIDRLTSAANTQYLDRYIFTGGEVNDATVSSKNGLVEFNGNNHSLLTIANNGEYVAHNVTGQRALGLISDSIVSRANLNPGISTNSHLSDLNNGNGVAPGAIQLTDGLERITIDLANAETIGDVINTINDQATLSGRPIQASVAGGTLRLEYQDAGPGNIQVSDTGAGRTAADLGIVSLSVASPSPIVGRALNSIIRPTTLLSQLNLGTGINTTGGLRIEQNGETYNVAVDPLGTVEDFTNAINRSGAKVRADISLDGKSIRVRTTESGSDFSIGENGGSLAAQLGLRSFDGQSRLDQLNYGRGVSFANGADLTITRNDGTTFDIDLNGSITIQNVIDQINSSVNNQDPLNRVTAGLSEFGNGITLRSPVYVPPPGPVSSVTPGPIKVTSANGSQTLYDLGLLPKGATESIANLSSGAYEIRGRDPNPQEVKGVFNSLIRLREAIENQDSAEVGRAIELVDKDLSRLSFSRGSLGVQQQRIDDLKAFQEDNKIELQADESRNLDADLASVITNLQARQASYEASLRLLSSSSQLSLFNYL